MSAPSVYFYRCRCCGVIDRKFISGDMLYALVGLAVESRDETPGCARLLGVHSCAPNRFGISDLLGACPREQEDAMLADIARRR